MKKPAEVKPSPWDLDETREASTTEVTVQKTDTPTQTKAVKATTTAVPTVAAKLAPVTPGLEFDIEGLMTDFPTATELQKFVYDSTGIVLNLKGRANKLKYQVAMDALNGQEIDEVFIGGDNPYIEKADLVPVEELKPAPARDPSLPDHDQIQNQFYSPFIPHPDPDYRARSKKVHCVFRKYRNGMISYEVLGPIDQRPEGEKMDKFGRMRPEIVRWVDPRTGEQVAQRPDGTLTPQGKRLRALMRTMRVNQSNQWDVWIDRDFIQNQDKVIRNPWAIDE